MPHHQIDYNVLGQNCNVKKPNWCFIYKYNLIKTTNKHYGSVLDGMFSSHDVSIQHIN